MDKKKRTIYIIYAIVVILIFMCVCGGYTFNKYGNDLLDIFVVDDPEEATAFGHEMINYELPPGYYESMGQKVGSTNIMLIKQQDDALSEIVLTEYVQEGVGERFSSGDLSVEQLAEEIHKARHYSMKLTQKYEMEINGKRVPMRLYTGVDEDGNAINQLFSGYFPGKRHGMVIFITGSVADWDQSVIDAFLNSIQ